MDLVTVSDQIYLRLQRLHQPEAWLIQQLQHYSLENYALSTRRCHNQQQKFLGQVGNVGSCCLKIAASTMLHDRDSIGELTVPNSTTALCSPAFAMASSTVQLRARVPPATAMKTIAKVRKENR